MNWEKLLSDIRLGQENRSATPFDGKRTGFQVDYDRIVFSPAFRRLQNKTQVFPLPSSDFVRNRLTHSLETASVGRSLGNLAGEKLLANYPSLRERFSFSDFGALVSAACLAHDIGNPPFGHAGEEAISNFFKSAVAQPYLSGLTDTQKADLQHFEGNAAGFRILTHTPPPVSAFSGGLNLCYSTLATFIKYPKPSFPSLKHTGIQSLKKYNYFDSERPVFDLLAESLGIPRFSVEGVVVSNRFPLAFLVEAADDICYTIIDFEDGFQMGLIGFEEIEETFMALAGKDSFPMDRYRQLYSQEARVAWLRSKVINRLVEETAHSFERVESSILLGECKQSLLDLLPQAEMLQTIKKTSFDRIYTCETILKIEAAGHRVLPGLLEVFIEALFSSSGAFNKRLVRLIPSDYLDMNRKPFDNPYLSLLNVAMYVGSLTDQHAIKLYRELFGISLPES